MLHWRDAYQLDVDVVVFVNEETRTAKTYDEDSTEIAVQVALFYFQRRGEYQHMGEEQFSAEYAKWWPKRDKLMEKFPPESLEEQKMEAFFTALHEERKARQMETFFTALHEERKARQRRDNNPKALAAS